MGEMHLCSVCAKAPAVETILKCDFCGVDQRHLRKLIKGPFGSDICDECAQAAHETAQEAIAVDAIKVKPTASAGEEA